MAASFTHGCVVGRGGGRGGASWLAGLCGKRSQTLGPPRSSGLAKPPQATKGVNSNTGGGGCSTLLVFCRQLAQEDLKLNLYPDSAAEGSEAGRLRELACD